MEKISAGEQHSLALKSDGTVVAWGGNSKGETNVPDGLTGVMSIAAGTYFSLALKSDGTVVAWGNNDWGQTNVPAGLTGVVSISAGVYHSLALKSDGTVVAWGRNNDGQSNVPGGLTGVVSIAAGGQHSLALKSDGTVVAWGYNSFGQTNVPGGLTDVVSIAAGYYHSMALKSDGTVVAWGQNASGQTNVPGGLSGVMSISARGFHSLALKSDGTVVAWGHNNFGQANVPAGLTGVVSIAGGVYHSLALKSDGTVVAWGYNDWGQTTVPAGLASPVKGSRIAGGTNHSLALKSDGTVVAWGDNNYGQTNVPVGLTGVVSIAGRGSHSLALKSDGTIVAWGYNGYGQTTVPNGLNGVVSIAGGGNHSLALKSDGTVAAWGYNGYGQTTVSGLTGVVSIAAGGFHSLALKSDGTVVAWGYNGYGQTTVPGGLTEVVSIAAGDYHSLALKSDGTVVAWGDNNYGQTTVPVGLTGVVSIAAGDYHSLALKSDGTVVAWGDNGEGQTTVPGNDNLNGLALQEGSFDKSFSPSVTSYTYSYIGSSVSSVNVTAELADTTYAGLYVNNQPQESDSAATVSISGDTTVIPVRVEPYFKPAKTYTITVLRDSTPPVISFGTNGNASWSQSASTAVTVTDAESGVDASSLQYAWTQSTATPSTGWTSFTSGGTLSKNGVDGDWYLHIRAQDGAGNTANAVSNRFRLRAASTGSTSTGSHSYVPDMKPVIDLNGGSPEPTVDVFNRSIVNEADLVKTIESKVAEAKEVNATMDFADTQGHWAEKTIDIFVQLNLINGYKDGTFRPNNPITRAEFAAFLNRAFNIQGGSHTSVVLKDIGDSWAKDEIENLVAAGVINGYTDGTFKPNQTITREEMVVMLSRIVNLNNLEKDTTKGNFNDLNGAYAVEEIHAAAQASIVSGKGDGRFDPKSNATRAEALQIILNVLKLNPQVKTLLDSLS
nr:S-layer homology domain-containing protein [Cohnella terricola]